MLTGGASIKANPVPILVSRCANRQSLGIPICFCAYKSPPMPFMESLRKLSPFPNPISFGLETEISIKMKRAIHWSPRSRRRGQNIVEFALVIPVLITLLLGILEAAWLGRAQLAAGNAVREGARLASVGKPVTEVKARVQKVGSFLALQPSEITVVYSTDGGTTFPNAVTDLNGRNTAPGGSLIKVEVDHPHRVVTGFFPFLRRYRDNAEGVMRRETS